jgi:hypothetical protein
MKPLLTVAVLAALLSSMEVWSQKRKHTDSVDVTITLKKRYSRNAPVDSVFIFFDKYNHTGAGVVKNVFYPKDDKIVIPQVPPGKYYIGMYCLGTHWEYLSEVTFVNMRRKNNLRFKLKRSELYVPGTFIAQVKLDMNRLAITNPKSFR